MSISGKQLFWMVFSIEIVLAMLYSIGPTIHEAKQDAWISFFIAGIIGLFYGYLVVKLSLRYPNQTFVQYSQTILGKWLGKIIILPYFVMWLYLNSMALRNSADFVYLTLFNKTPLTIITISFMVLVVYLVYSGGLVGIARCAEIMGPMILIMIVGTCILSINHLEWQQLLPVFVDNGVGGILKGAIPASAFYSDVIMFTMVYAFLSDKKKAMKKTLWGMGIASMLVMSASILVMMTFGPILSSRMWAPFFGMTRFISVMGFIQNVDIFVVVIWMFSAFIKLSMFLFVMVYAVAQWFNVENWKRLIWILAPISVICALIPENSTAPVKEYVEAYWIPIAMPINIIGIPILLWIVDVIRHKASHKEVGER